MLYDLEQRATMPDASSIAGLYEYGTPQMLGDLTWANASHDTIRGKIESRWKNDHGHFTLRIVVPVGTHATVVVPSREGPQTYERNSGTCTFTSVLLP